MVWHTILDWLAVVSGVVALLHFFFPKHGARAGDYILNRFAERSRAKTEQRIQRLQTKLSKVEPLSVLTEFEAMVLKGFSIVLRIIMATPTLVLASYALKECSESSPRPIDL